MSLEGVEVTPWVRQVLEWALESLGVFVVLNLQLQLFDAHVPLVEELLQPPDLLLLLVELHSQLWTKHMHNILHYISRTSFPQETEGDMETFFCYF